MKNLRKVLSILLAALLVLGSVPEISLQVAAAAVEEGAASLAETVGGGVENVLEAVRLADDSSTVSYAVTGGNIYFDTSSGTITDADDTVTEANIPSTIEGVTVEIIGGCAFYGCSSLTSISIPDSVTRIDSQAFRDTALKNIYVPSSVVSMEGNSSMGWLAGCTQLQEITLGEGTTKVINNSLACINSDFTIHFPSTLKEIGNDAFLGCEKLTSIVIPDAITKIGSYAFAYCSALKEVDIPNGVTEIGSCAFKETPLKSIYIPASVVNNSGTGGWFEGCEQLEEVTLGEGTEKVVPYSLKWIRADFSISFPNTLKEIGNDAFLGCEELTSIVIPDTVERIESYAFVNCTNLKYINIPKETTEIGGNAFSNCPNLCVLCDFDSYAMVYAIENDIQVKQLEFTDSPDRALDYYKSSYYAATDSISANGTLPMTVTYQFKDETCGDVSDLSVKIYIPKIAELYVNTIKVDGNLCTDYSYNESTRLLTIPVAALSGQIRFSMEVTGQGNLVSYARLSYEKGSETVYEMIGIVCEPLKVLTLSAEEQTSQAQVAVSGIAPASASVTLSLDGTEQSVVTALKSGAWSGTITIPTDTDYATYTLKASCLSGSETVSVSRQILYQPNAPVLTGLELTYNEHEAVKTCDLIGTDGTKPKVYFYPQYPYQFTAKFDNGDNIETVYITSTRNNETKYMEAEYSEEQDCYVAKGYFDPDSHSYVPGKIGVEYTLKYEDVYVDQNMEWDSWNNGLSDEMKAATVIGEATEDTLTTTVDLGSVFLDLAEVSLDVVIQSYDGINGTSFGDFQAVWGENKTILSYLVPGVDDSQYIVNLDYSDPYTYAMLVKDVSSSKYLELIISAHKDTDFWELEDEILSHMSTVSTVADVFLKAHGIQEDTEQLKEKIQIAYANDPDARKAAEKEADALGNDRMMFLLLATVLPIIVTAPIAVGASMSAAPAILFSGLLGVITSTSSMFWDIRENNILGGTFSLNWIVDPSGYVYDADTEERIKGVTATAYCIPYDETVENFWENKPGEEEYGELWDASEYEQANPLLTNVDGKYAWDVPEGWWRVKYEKEGYETVWSEWMTVPPVQTDVNIAMFSTETQDYSVACSELTDSAATVSVTNNTDSSQKVTVILAAYNEDGKMIICNTATETSDAGQETSVKISYSASAGVCRVKTFVLDAETKQPLCRVWTRTV